MVWSNVAGAIIGGVAGATSPMARAFDYKKAGLNFITGYTQDRLKDMQPIYQNMKNWALGKGLLLSGAQRATLAAGSLARLAKGTDNIVTGIKERMIGRGAGAGDGMGEAGILQARMAGLNAQRDLLGQVEGQEIGALKGRQQSAAQNVMGLAERDQAAENDLAAKSWASKEAVRMQGNRTQRILGGVWQGWSSGGGGGLGMG